MIFTKTKLDGVYIIEPDVHGDNRGSLIKIFYRDAFLREKIDISFEESYFSISKRNVLRGMHFQIPPADHAKLVYVPRGSILDAVLDIRKNSPTYGEYISMELSEKNHTMIYIPSGFAHGFLSLEDNSIVTYLQTTMRSPEHEGGIHPDSFGIKWSTKNPVMSDRDKSFPRLDEFKTPFNFTQ